MLVHVNYSKSYENKQQDYWQSAYFGHSTFSILTAVVYIRCNWELLHESIVIISEAKDHSRIAADTCISKVIDIMMKKYPHLTSYMSVDLYVWSDECSAKFRSKYLFTLTSLFPVSFNVTRYYNERHHRKGPMDGIGGGCVKSVVYCAAMARREVIKSPKDFAECSHKLVNGIHCYYLSIEQVMEETESIAPSSNTCTSLYTYG